MHKMMQQDDESSLKAITIRKLPPELARRLEEEARKEGASLAQTVIRLLLKATGLGGGKAGRIRCHDLDELAGTWDPEEAAAFDRAVAEQRPIDPDVWE